MQQRNLCLTSFMTASYTITNGWANITGLVITIPEDGIFDIKTTLTSQQNHSTDQSIFRLAINGNPIGNEKVFAYTPASVSYIPVTLSQDNIMLKTGDVVSVQTAYLSGTDGVVYYSNAESVASLKIIKRGL